MDVQKNICTSVTQENTKIHINEQWYILENIGHYALVCNEKYLKDKSFYDK